MSHLAIVYMLLLQFTLMENGDHDQAKIGAKRVRSQEKD
jgi:hypothetical protein